MAKKTGWGDAQHTAENHKGNSLYVRLENDGEKVIGTFCGEPLTRELCWVEKTNSYEEFSPEHAKAGRKMTPRFALNFFVPASANDPAPSMRVLECNLTTFKDVLKCRDKYGMGKWAFEIERNGAKGDTKTKYTILPERELTAEEIKMCGKPGPGDTWIEGSVPLQKLEEVVGKDEDEKTDLNSHDKKKTEAAPPAPAAAAAPPAPPVSTTIPAELATRLVARLKEIPRDKGVDKFLAKFGVAKIKEVKASDADAAAAYVSELEGKPAPQAQAVVDPFAD